MNEDDNRLTNAERELSKKASKELGFEVMVYKDDDWICDPVSSEYRIGYGTTPEEAIQDCRQMQEPPEDKHGEII